MRSHLIAAGIEASQLDWFCENPCPPDIVGINHYVTSDRYLDERVDRYPSSAAGSNGKHEYADVEAVRVVEDFDAGWTSILAEAHRRYGLPLALTEVHIGCTKEEQLRWFMEAWSSAKRANMSGQDVRAVTAWALFGSFDWNSLLTRDAGHYEPGAFDIRSSEPRPTALAHLLRTIAAKGDVQHPLLDSPGWWRRPERKLVSACVRQRSPRPRRSRQLATRMPPLLILADSARWVSALAGLCGVRGLEYLTKTVEPADRSTVESLEALLARAAPWAVVDFTGLLTAAEHEASFGAIHRAAHGSALAEAAVRRGVRLLRFLALSDAAEAMAWHPQRVPHGRSLVVHARMGPLEAHDDSAVASFLNAALDLLIDGESGVWELPFSASSQSADHTRRSRHRELTSCDLPDGCWAWHASRDLTKSR